MIFAVFACPWIMALTNGLRETEGTMLAVTTSIMENILRYLGRLVKPFFLVAACGWRQDRIAVEKRQSGPDIGPCQNQATRSTHLG
jgi:hypothetical protein